MSFSEFDRAFKNTQRFVICAWIGSAIVSFGVLGLAAWAVVKLVNHFAG